MSSNQPLQEPETLRNATNESTFLRYSQLVLIESL